MKHPKTDIADAALYTVITADTQNAAIALVTERIQTQRPDLDLDEDYFFIVAPDPRPSKKCAPYCASRMP